MLGTPGKRWWQGGEITTYALDRGHTREMLLGIVDRARDTVHATLDRARLGPADVDFYASHQGTIWFTDVTAGHAGLTRARAITTFPRFANMNSVNVPFILALGEREGMIRDGSVVATFSGGLGETWSSVLFRWGR